MIIDRNKAIELIKKNIPELKQAVYSNNHKRADFVKLFGTANWLYNFLSEIDKCGGNNWEQKKEFEEIQKNIYKRTVVPGLSMDCPCGYEHEELQDLETAFRDSKPLLILQKSSTGKLYLAYKFLAKANSSMAIEIGGRMKDGALRLSCSDLEEMMFRRGPRHPMKEFVKKYMQDVSAWAEKLENLDIPHIISFANHYKKWKPAELQLENKKVEEKWDQYVESCQGKVRNLHIGHLGYMYRCNICCYKNGCKKENALCAEQAEG